MSHHRTDLMALGQGSGLGLSGCSCGFDTNQLGMMMAAAIGFFALYTAITMQATGRRKRKRSTAFGAASPGYGAAPWSAVGGGDDDDLGSEDVRAEQARRKAKMERRGTPYFNKFLYILITFCKP